MKTSMRPRCPFRAPLVVPALPSPEGGSFQCLNRQFGQRQRRGALVSQRFGRLRTGCYLARNGSELGTHSPRRRGAWHILRARVLGSARAATGAVGRSCTALAGQSRHSDSRRVAGAVADTRRRSRHCGDRRSARLGPAQHHAVAAGAGGADRVSGARSGDLCAACRVSQSAGAVAIAPDASRRPRYRCFDRAALPPNRDHPLDADQDCRGGTARRPGDCGDCIRGRAECDLDVQPLATPRCRAGWIELSG